MNTGKHIKIERAILGTLFVAYFGGIAYALFFMFPPNFGTDGAIRHAANFALGVAVCEAYTAGGAGLIGSQFMWNILLFEQSVLQIDPYMQANTPPDSFAFVGCIL